MKTASNTAMEKMGANAGKACALLKSMANQSRLMILCQLAEREMSVGELLESVPLSQSALSQHLSMLRREKIVTTRRIAQSIMYSLDSEDARVLINTLYELYCKGTEEDNCTVVDKEAAFI
ncbi:MAG: metalloregulator ArsR/SmtB family transcription factor [Robiginitomaculum sp.]|nr:metalloregulator ArsR/SmtB family transcription factor [Robiginitomaculum sp.]